MHENPNQETMELQPVMITCRGCKCDYPIKSIVQHVTKSNCKIYYSKEEETNLRKQSMEITNAKHRSKMNIKS